SSNRDQANNGLDVAYPPLLVSTTQPFEQFGERWIDEYQPAHPVVDEPVAALAQQNTPARHDRAEQIGTRIEVNLADCRVDVLHELGRSEPAIPVLLIALTPIGPLRRASTRLGREHRQQSQQAGD